MANIIKVKMEDSYVAVTYESGITRSYDKAKTPKTVSAWLEKNANAQETETRTETVAWSSPYFKDESAEVIFYLLVMSGRERTDYLGITPALYMNKEMAHEWVVGINQKIRKNPNPRAEQASNVLGKIYAHMITDDITAGNF